MLKRGPALMSVCRGQIKERCVHTWERHSATQRNRPTMLPEPWLFTLSRGDRIGRSTETESRLVARSGRVEGKRGWLGTGTEFLLYRHQTWNCTLQVGEFHGM